MKSTPRYDGREPLNLGLAALLTTTDSQGDAPPVSDGSSTMTTSSHDGREGQSESAYARMAEGGQWSELAREAERVLALANKDPEATLWWVKSQLVLGEMPAYVVRAPLETILSDCLAEKPLANLARQVALEVAERCEREGDSVEALFLMLRVDASTHAPDRFYTLAKSSFEDLSRRPKTTRSEREQQLLEKLEAIGVHLRQRETTSDHRSNPQLALVRGPREPRVGTVFASFAVVVGVCAIWWLLPIDEREASAHRVEHLSLERAPMPDIVADGPKVTSLIPPDVAPVSIPSPLEELARGVQALFGSDPPGQARDLIDMQPENPQAVPAHVRVVAGAGGSREGEERNARVNPSLHELNLRGPREPREIAELRRRGGDPLEIPEHQRIDDAQSRQLFPEPRSEVYGPSNNAAAGSGRGFAQPQDYKLLRRVLVREEPQAGSRTLELLEEGTKIRVEGKSRGWLQLVSRTGQVGYVREADAAPLERSDGGARVTIGIPVVR